MEQNSLTPNHEPSNPKPNRLTALAFLEIGLFEIGFVTITILLIFGIVNYFNLLPISAVFPKYLGWLPRQLTQQEKLAQQGETLESFIGNYKKNNPSNRSSPAPTPTPPVSLAFVNNTLKPYVSSVLNPDVSYSIVGMLKLQDKDNLNSSIGINLDTNKGTVSGILLLSKNKDDISLVNLSFPKTLPSSSSLSLDDIQKEASSFFAAKPKEAWGCKTIENPPANIQYCESFWEEDNGVKRGLYYQDPVSVDNRTNEKKVNFSFCEYRIDSDRYSWKSCIPAFQERGINL